MDIRADLSIREIGKPHPCDHRGDPLRCDGRCCRRPSQQAVAREQRATAAGHALPAAPGCIRIRGLAEHLTAKNQERVTAEHAGDACCAAVHRLPIALIRESRGHRPGLGPGKPLHQLFRIGGVKCLLVHPARLNAMGDSGLLKQAPACRRGGSQKQHGEDSEHGWIKATTTRVRSSGRGASMAGMHLPAEPGPSPAAAPGMPPPAADRSLRRARQALGCLPFRRALYEQLASSALSSSAIAAAGSRYSRSRLNASQVEGHLIWLIQLGVLRREVDGQGLTERVRLTPMGRHLLSTIPAEIPGAGPLTRLRHWLRRHRPRL